MVALATATVLGAGRPGDAAATDPVAGTVWLTVAGSDSSPGEIARKARELARRANTSGFTFRAADCGDGKKVFGWAASTSSDPGRAQAALTELRDAVPDAYLKKCRVKPRSLLALGYPAVDPSIADVPTDAVNWADEDRISSAIPLPHDVTLTLLRYYQPDKNDPLEGRRTRVVAIRSGTDRVVLSENCQDANGTVAPNGYLLLQCSSEQAADNVLHRVSVYDDAGKKLLDVDRCRGARLSGQAVSCDKESVGPDGALKLLRTSVSLR